MHKTKGPIAKMVYCIKRYSTIAKNDIYIAPKNISLKKITPKSTKTHEEHVLRMPPERTARKVLLTAPDERRPIGRPRATWIKQINGLCRRAGIEPSETQTLAEDRSEWKRLTTCLTSRPERTMRA